MTTSLSFRTRLLTALSLLTCALSLQAQSIMVEDRTPPATPRSIATSSGQTAGSTDTSSPVEFGRIRLRPSAYVRLMRASDLPTGSGSADTTIATFNAGLGLELGDSVVLSYAPTWINYSGPQFRDSVNHAFSLSAATRSNDWDLRLDTQVSSSNDVLAETATQTKQRSWQSNINAAQAFGQRSRYEGGFSFNRSETDQGIASLDLTSETYSTDQWLRSQITPRFSAGLGIGLGWLELQQRPDIRYDRYLASIDWRPTEKIGLSVQGGAENRHSTGTNLSNPHLQALLNYQPLTHTRLSLGWSQTTGHSPITNQLTESTGWNFSLSQRLLEKLQLSLNYRAAESDYSSFGSAPSILALRSDEVRSFNATLSVQLYQRLTLSAIFQSSRNNSTSASLDFSTKQYGLELRARF